jgi:hypothetical protein
VDERYPVGTIAYQPLDPLYSQPGVDCYASTLRSQFTSALDAATAAAGGRLVTVAGTTA